MLDSDEWDWVHEHATGGFDHLLIGTSLPWLLGPGMHYAEAWSEAVAGGAWGPVAANAAEKMRQAADMEHWPAFQESFARLVELFRAIGTGERGEPPASIVALSGDVHHAYLAEVGYPRGTGMRSNVWQAVCSPYRNPLEKKERDQIRIGWSRGFELFTRALARLAGVRDPGIGWRMVGDGPWFDNQVATLIVDGREHAHAHRQGRAGGRGERTARVRARAPAGLGPPRAALRWPTRRMDYPVETFTDEERALLAPHFTNLDRPVFALVNLPETVKGALFARYSRYQGTLRRLYLEEFADERRAGRAVRRRGGRARPKALRAHLHRLRGRLGGAARRRAHRLRVGLERDDEAAPARPAGRLPRAVHALHALRRADRATGSATATGATPSSGRSTRRRWTSCSSRTPRRCRGWRRGRPSASRARATSPRRAHARSIRAKALDLLRGLLPAASLSHVGHLRLGPGLRAAAACGCSPRRCPRRATTRA